MEILKLPVPEGLTALYLVPVSKSPRRLKELVKKGISEQLDGFIRDLSLKLLPTELFSVRAVPTKSFPPMPYLDLFGATSEQIEIVEKSKQFILVQVVFSAGWPPIHEYVARAVAAVLAAQLDSLVIDLFTPKILSAETAKASLPDEHGFIRLSDWLTVPLSTGRNGYWFTTQGLARLGLPELQAIDVPASIIQQWTYVMTSIAFVVLTHAMSGREPDEPAPANFELPGTLTVTDSDIAGAYGGTVAEEEGHQECSVTIRVVFDEPDEPGKVPFLTILPPEGEGRSSGEYFVEVCKSLFEIEEGEIRFAPMDEEMEEAIARALETLDEVRQRFVSKDFPHDQVLLVKHLVSDGENIEYVWTYVNDWSAAEFLQGTCGNDAQWDSKIRAGRTVRVETDSIIDWMICSADGDIVEGGWTQAVALKDR